MSFNGFIKSWKELIEFLQKHDNPQCFTVNYVPSIDEYQIWIGNQPYYSYENLIDLEKGEKEELKMKFERLESYVKRLEIQNEAMRKIIRDPDRFPPIRKWEIDMWG